jgi:8-oxo-dGTP diphosphatase
MKPVTRLMPPGSLDDAELTYVVMGACYRGQWIFVRHHRRASWEMPAGHIEPGESPDNAAARELYEETGASGSTLKVVSDYSVTVRDKTEYGRFYRAEVTRLGPLPEYEIAEIKLCGELPSPFTYPEVQTPLFSLLTLQ